MDIGRKLFGSSLLPFLKIGVTLASFLSVGKMPVLIDFINIWVSHGAIMLPAILRFRFRFRFLLLCTIYNTYSIKYVLFTYSKYSKYYLQHL